MFGDSQSDDGRYYLHLGVISYIGIKLCVPSHRRAYIKSDGSDSHEVSNVLVMNICEKESVW